MVLPRQFLLKSVVFLEGGSVDRRALENSSVRQLSFLMIAPANDLPSDQVLTAQLLHVALGLIVSGGRENGHPYELPPSFF